MYLLDTKDVTVERSIRPKPLVHFFAAVGASLPVTSTIPRLGSPVGTANHLSEKKGENMLVTAGEKRQNSGS
jgi:hypothetical protein